jgi:uncharacterized cupredoxin-like copper-binding protein
MVMRLRPLMAAVVIGLPLAGCGLADGEQNIVNGKQQFVAKCGACHTLARAGTTGVSGPDLDAAFVQARKDGFGESTFEGVVLSQILQPARTSQVDPKTGAVMPGMPAEIVTGSDAKDVAAYVATSAGAGGDDPGRLAKIGVKKAEGVAKAQNGTLEIPADPGGSLAYAFAAAEAPAGPVAIKSQNESSTPHDIAVEGNGVNDKGEVVQGGGVSEVSVDLQPGEYTFYCSVPGHRQGGMEGKLTVK